MEHVRDHGLQAAPHAKVLHFAGEHDRAVVSANTDLVTLLARTGADHPSVILIRRSSGRGGAPLLANLDQIAEDLHSGAIVVVTDADLRIRLLPIPPGP